MFRRQDGQTERMQVGLIPYFLSISCHVKESGRATNWFDQLILSSQP